MPVHQVYIRAGVRKFVVTEYAILVHDRQTEDGPSNGTVICTSNGTYWHAMVSGHMDWCHEVLDALCYREHDLTEKQAESVARLKEELGYD
jgi:hypothetical protein